MLPNSADAGTAPGVPFLTSAMGRPIYLRTDKFPFNLSLFSALTLPHFDGVRIAE